MKSIPIAKTSKSIYVIQSNNQYEIRRGIGAPNTTIVEREEELVIIDLGVWTHNLTIYLEKKVYLT
ncbi:MAG: hypothetical protein ACTSQE_15605 [Candidatus Heimdallarchaeaceae archaeon]